MSTYPGNAHYFQGTATAPAEQGSFYAEQAAQLFRNAPAALLVGIINSSVLVFVLRTVISSQVLTLWLSTIILLSALRYMHLRKFRHASQEPRKARRWAAQYVVGTALSGVAWSSAGIFLFPAESIPHQTFLAFVIGGNVAGAAATYSIILRAFFAYSVPVLTLLVIRFLLIGDEIHMAMGGMALLYAVVIAVVATRIHAVTVTSLRLGLENSSLVSYLTSAKEHAEELNSELTAEISERRKAEQEVAAHREHLEELVAERTREWAQANAQLQKEVAVRKRVEEALRAAKEGLEMRVQERTMELLEMNRELEAEIVERRHTVNELADSRQQLRKLFAHLQSVREEERTSIAREIHDELGQVLTAINMDLSWIRERLPGNLELVAEKADESLQLVYRTIQSVKRICTELRPAILDHLGLDAAIEWQAEEFQKRTGIECEIRVESEGGVLSSDISTALFRIFQEALTNVARHAKATKVEAILTGDERIVGLEVRDNGKGITEEELSKSHSFGLQGMRERVHSLAGDVSITGSSNEGTSVKVSIPIEQKKNAGE